MPVFSILSYADGGNVAPTPEDMVTWSDFRWQTNTVTISESEIVAIRDGRKLILRGSFVETPSGAWDGTVTEVQIDLPATVHPAGIGRSLLTGVNIPLAPNVTIFGGSLPQFNPNGQFNGAAILNYAGNDSMSGGERADSLAGYDGADTLTGGGGRDTLIGGLGDDRFIVEAMDLVAGEIYAGGAGIDTLRLTGASGTFDFRGVTISGIEALEFVAIGDGTLQLDGAQIGGASGISSLNGNGVFRNLFIHGSTDTSQVNFGAPATFGVNHIGTSGADTIRTGWDGNPFGLNNVRPGAGADTVQGGAGNDFVFIEDGDLPTSGAVEHLSFGAGIDTLVIMSGHIDLRRHAVATDYEHITLFAGAGSLTLNASQIRPLAGFSLGGSATPIPVFIRNAANLDLSPVIMSAGWLASTANPIDIEGTFGNDTITGSARADVIRGLGGSDTLNGGGGDDVFIQSLDLNGLPSHARIDGGAGRDVFVVEGRVSARLDAVEVVQFGAAPTSGPNQFTALGLDSRELGIINTFTLDSVIGAAGRQIFEVSAQPFTGPAQINLSSIAFSQWQAGQDEVRIDVRVREGSVIGSAVADKVTTLSSGQQVAFAMGDGDDTVAFAEGVDPVFIGSYDGGAGVDTLALIWEVLGPPSGFDMRGYVIRNVERLEVADVMTTILPASFFGDAGVRTIRSIAYNAEGLADRGPLTIVGQTIDLTNLAWADAARPIATYVRGTESFDLVNLGSFDVTDVQTGAGNDTVRGGANAERIWGGADQDTLFGAGGNDTLLGETGADVLWGGDGNDLAYGWLGADTLLGDAGADTLFGEQDNDVLYGWLGADLLWGGAGNDTLWGEQDNDTLLGEVGNDVLLGIDGNDVMYGWLGNDTLYGWIGDDVLFGEADNDRLFGEGGNDTIVGGLGRDTMTGGAGADRFFNANFEMAAGEVDLITDYDAADRYLFQTGAQIQYFNFNAPGYGVGAGIHVQVQGGVFILDVFGATAAQLQAQTQFF